MIITYSIIGVFKNGVLQNHSLLLERTTQEELIKALDSVKIEDDTPNGCKRCIQYTIEESNRLVTIPFVDNASSDRSRRYRFKINSEAVKGSIMYNEDLCSEYAYAERVNGPMKFDDFLQYREDGTLEDPAY